MRLNPRIAIPHLTTLLRTAFDPTVQQATKYLTPTLIARVTRRFKHRARDRRQEFVVTVGEPNYREREFIRDCRRAGESFPVKRVILKHARPKPRGR